MSEGWRVFVGVDIEDPEWTIIDRTFATWDAARLFLLALFVRWAADDCDYCARHAMEQLPEVAELAPGQSWVGEVEGDDYVLAVAQ